MLRAACQRKQPLSVVVFELSDLPELECTFSHEVARHVVARFGAQLEQMAGSTGLAVRTASTMFTVMMPDVDRQDALDRIYGTLGEPCCIEIEVDEDDIVLVPEFRVRTLWTGTAPLADTYNALRQDIAEAQIDKQRRQSSSRRMRQSDSKGMARSLPQQQPWAATRPAHGPRIRV